MYQVKILFFFICCVTDATSHLPRKTKSIFFKLFTTSLKLIFLASCSNTEKVVWMSRRKGIFLCLLMSLALHGYLETHPPHYLCCVQMKKKKKKAIQFIKSRNDSRYISDIYIVLLCAA